MTLNVRKTVPDAVLPTRAHASDAGLDMYACESVTLRPGERSTVRTGIAVAIPEGFVGLIWDKSGRAINDGFKTMGGVIDAGYRGEILVIVVNLDTSDLVIGTGQKVAQLLMQKVELPEVVEVADLDETARAAGAFGSTGI